MKKSLLLLIVLFSGNLLLAQRSLPPAIMQRPADFESLSAPDSTGLRAFLKIPNSVSIQTQSVELPYPVIFMHGLNSSGETWNTMTDFMDSQYGTVYGGRFDFCLNYDGNNVTANTNFAPSIGADMALFSGTWIGGDYYYMNFDVGSNGSVHPNGNSYDVLSNQQAIMKQGLALKWAIYYVLQITGREKVVLVGHSMGGLESREYLENPGLWQADGMHHVAKLVTTGTPHGGSDAYGPQWITGVDSRSDAVRDLKTSYAYSGAPGVYLFGGYETNAVMDDFSSGYFYNVDVNCNGQTGNLITGLNQKSLYTNLEYSCIIGKCTSCFFGQELPGDGVVNDAKANLNNYYTNITKNVFIYSASAFVEIHTDLPDQRYQNMQGMDEPAYFNLAYKIDFDSSYIGFNTVQAAASPFYPVDYDDYKFSVPALGNVTVNINYIALADLMVHVVDSAYNTVGTLVHSNGNSSINFTQMLSTGNYYLEIYGTPNTSSYLYPYQFQLTYSPCQAPLQPGSISGTSTPCLNSSQTYSVSPVSGATSYTWTLPSGWNGTSNNDSITVTVGSSSGNICVTANNTCGTSNQSCIAVNVNPLPSTPVISGNSSVCAGQSTTLTVDNPCSGCTYQWSNGMTGQSISVNTAGTYTATSTNNCGTSSNSNGLTVVVNPLPDNPALSGDTSICTGQSTTLTISNTCAGCTYQWSTADTGQSISVNTSGTYSLTVTDVNGCVASASTIVTVINCNPALSLKVFMQGYYISNGTMQPVLLNEGVAGASITQMDSVLIALQDSANPTICVDSVETVLATDGTVLVTFTSALAGNSYWIVVKHRNTVETWSSSPVYFNTNTSFDFSTAATQAYGNNMIYGDGVWALYSGDLNRDGNIDILDFPSLDYGIMFGLFGYYHIDLNGDGNVDILDFPILNYGIAFGIFCNRP